MSPNRPRLLIGVVIVSALFLASCGQGDSQVAAVGDETLTQDDLLAILAAGGEEPASASTTEAAEAVNEWLFWELLLAELSERGHGMSERALEAGGDLLANNPPAAGPPPPDGRYYELLVRYRTVPYLAARWLEAEGIDPSPPSELCSSHILLETEEEAEAAIARFEAGEDFAALAIELSTGPSGPSGGVLGCVDAAGFVPEFVAGAAAVEPPGISEPTESQFGWHVIYVDSFDEGQFADDQARDEAILGAAPDQILELQEAALERDVELDSEYGTWDSTTGRIVQPDAVG